MPSTTGRCLHASMHRTVPRREQPSLVRSSQATPPAHSQDDGPSPAAAAPADTESSGPPTLGPAAPYGALLTQEVCQLHAASTLP